MKLRPLSKLEKKNVITPKKFENDVIANFLVISRFGAIWKTDYRSMVHGTFLDFHLDFYLLKLHICLYLRSEFQVSDIILTSP